jgi:CubicO group peptidase (beta-lactamase class C family)
MRHITRAACILLLLLTSPAFPGGFEKKTELFDAQVFELRKKARISGLTAGIVKEGKLAWSAAYGFADIDQTIPVTVDTPYWIASVTKTFVGLLFLQLEEAGKVNLQDRMADVPGFPDFCAWLSSSGLPFARDLRCDAPITVDHVLRHTSGGTPGTQFLYNPILFSRLSRYLEHKLGKSVEEVEGRQNSMAQLVEEKILKPAGMQHTMSSMWQREKCQVFFDMAQGLGLTPEGKLVKRPLPDRELAGGAGIVSTLSDLARYDAALDAGTLASRTVMTKLFTPAATPDGKTLPYAYGWYVQDYRGQRLYWHSGWDPDAGYSSLMLKVPAKKLTLILLANGEGIWWNNPLDAAIIEQSPIARFFLETFVFEN